MSELEKYEEQEDPSLSRHGYGNVETTDRIEAHTKPEKSLLRVMQRYLSPCRRNWRVEM